MPGWLQAMLALAAGAMLAASVTTGIFLVLNNKTDAHQTGQITEAFRQLTDSQQQGCANANRRVRQSNARVPLERVEAKTALIVAVVVRKFNLDVPVELDPAEIRRLTRNVRRVPLTACQRLYRAPELPEGVSFTPTSQR